MLSSFFLAAALLGQGAPPHAGGWLPVEIRLTTDVLLQGANGFGGVEFLGGASVGGVGLSAALAYERVVTAHTIRHGGYMLALFELVPTAWTTRLVHRHFGVHLGVGGMVGGLQGADVRNGVVLSAGFTIPIVLDMGNKTQLAVSIHYRAQLKQTPDDIPVHVLVLGIGPRWQN